jgi:hypothetical protein
MSNTPTRIIKAATVQECELQITAAVEDLQAIARKEGLHGILVTRTGPGCFTVELNECVPFGITEETVATSDTRQ